MSLEVASTAEVQALFLAAQRRMQHGIERLRELLTLTTTVLLLHRGVVALRVRPLG